MTLILCARVSWPVPAIRYRTFTEEEDVKMAPLLDGAPHRPHYAVVLRRESLALLVVRRAG